MSDLSKWKVRGAVRTLRSEHAQWDLAQETWGIPRAVSAVEFLPNGSVTRIAHYNPDGSVHRIVHLYDPSGRLAEVRSGRDGEEPAISTYHYDGLGRLVRIAQVGEDGAEGDSVTYRYNPDGSEICESVLPELQPDAALAWSIEGDQAYPATGAATVIARYNERGQAEEASFCDRDHRVLRRVVFTRDSEGRLAREEMRNGEQGYCEEAALASAPAEAREAMEAALAGMLSPGGVFATTTYDYDQKGRLLQRRRRLGEVGEYRSTFAYDDHDNAIEETVEDIAREMSIGEDGAIRVDENRSIQNIRFEYLYDSRGNWTERVVWTRLEPNPNFQRSNVERRRITYYESLVAKG